LPNSESRRRRLRSAGRFYNVSAWLVLSAEDIDVLPSRTNENLERLATALKLMNAHVRTSGEPVPVSVGAGFLEQMTVVLNLVTDFGMINLTFTLTGPSLTTNLGKLTQATKRLQIV